MLLPEPDAPTIATRSPAHVEVDAEQHRHLDLALQIDLAQAAAGEHGLTIASLIAQRLRRIDFRGALARIDRREQADHERETTPSASTSRSTQLRGQVADLVDVLGQELEAEQASR